jgi:hypothetical protein
VFQAYPARASVAPGESLVLHISTDAPRFRVGLYRWGDGFTLMQISRWLRGEQVAPLGAAQDWDWPGYELPIPESWPSAAYVALLEDPAPVELRSVFQRAAALFVVRGRGESPLLYKLPLATYHAYNCTGGGCFYVNPPRSGTPPGSKVTLRRPGGGIGGETCGAPDYYDPSSPRQTFAHWDAAFIRWLLRTGYAPEFCTDLDIHENAELCSGRRLLLNVGHDEYWSEPTRDRVEAFVEAGGNLAFFGANVCWWRIHVVDEGSAIVCHQGGPQGALDHWWPETGVNRPEDALTGVSYRHGGGWWDGPRRSHGYVVQQPDHWVFAGTGLHAGEAVGRDTLPPLVGYECDGAPLEHFDAATGEARLARNARRCGTPDGFELLAASPLQADWQELPPREPLVAAGPHAATMGLFSRKGTVFTAGTTDWAQVLAGGQDGRIERITHNVLDRLLQS